MKKVLIIENSLYVTGGLNAVLSTVESLKHEFVFYFMIPEISQVGDIIKSKGYTVEKLPFLEVSRRISSVLYLPRLYQNARKVLKYMRQENIGILHVNDVFNMVGCMAKQLNPSIKLVNHVRLLKTSYIGPLYSIFTSQVKKYADRIICVSEAVKRDIGATSKSVVIYDTPKISCHYESWDGLLHPHALNILYVGNYVRGKGQQYGLKAFNEFQKQYPGSCIKFVGAVNDASSGQFKTELMQLAKESGISEKVTFGDKATDIEKEMKRHDVVLNLSESESFSFVCLEALLYGVPLIAANSGGPAEITDNGQKAILINNKDYQAAARALEYIVEHRAEIRQKVQIAKEWAEEKFSPVVSKLQFQEIYNDLT